MSGKIWVYVDHFKGEALHASWEAIGAGMSLADQFGGGVTALVLGSEADGVAQEAIHYGADKVILVDDPALADYRPEPFATILSRLAAESKPEVILFPTTTRGRDLAAMVAVDLNTGVLVDVISLEVMDGT